MIDIQPTILSLTDVAAGKLREITAAETNPNSACASTSTRGLLRLPVRDDDRGRADPRGPGPRVAGDQGLRRHEEPRPAAGSQIDYVDTLMGAGFTVNNPNAVAACGCGSSFRTAD